MARGDYVPENKKPTDDMWVITADDIQTIRRNLGGLPYDVVAPTIETFDRLKPLKIYLDKETPEASTSEVVPKENKTLSLKKE